MRKSVLKTEKVSAKENFEKLNDISCMNGIRCLMTFLVFGLHSFAFRINSLEIVRSLKLFFISNEIFLEFLLTVSCVVDTFFIMSGILYTRSIARKIRR